MLRVRPRRHWLTDGFVGRPGLTPVLFGELAFNPAAISAALTRAGVARLAAVVSVYAHYDHALDAAIVADQTGTPLVGSSSTANLDHGLSETCLRVVVEGEQLELGRLRVTFVVASHSPGDPDPDVIAHPLHPAARRVVGELRSQNRRT